VAAVIAYDLTDAPSAAQLAAIDAGLGAFNEAVAELANVRRLVVTAHDQAGAIQGGALGRTWGECCELLQLWVADPVRGQGLGRGLLQRFEREARARGCTLVYLDTFSFQAPAFYEALGYRAVLETRGFTGGIVKYTMHKPLGVP
jgi:GNAT superfamily N-acetyltransferase